VTPGFAKPRSELPWLPYGETDRVIINAHNFTPAVFDPSVNGKVPVAAWIESRDPEAVTSATATDLVGTNHGTLTSMDLTADPDTARISDTGAGGVRALNFDASNDYVSLGSTIVLPFSSAFSISWWEKVTTSSGTYRSRLRLRNGTNDFFVFRSDDSSYATLSFGPGRGVATMKSACATLTASVGTWKHFVIVGASGSNSNTVADYSVYEDGVAKTVVAGGFYGVSNGQSRIGWDGADDPANCRMDDIRIWHQSLDATDATSLYASGSGRGI